MWSDNESSSDYIDYSHLSDAISSIINNPDLLPCSIGVFGDWGSGKSSLMKMVQHRLEKEKDVLVIKFNGWLFEGYEDAKTVLMGRIVDEIIDNRKFTEKAIKYAAKLLKRIDWIKAGKSLAKYGIAYAATGPLGAAGMAAAESLGKINDIDYESYIKAKQDEKQEDKDETLRSNIQEFHKNFEDLISETGIKKIIVFIDDLDRCSPDTVISTLEAIKLFLFTKNTAFIIGADERLIKYSVRRRFPEVPGENMEVGRDYLEKLIQYPIRIPELNTIELTTYINLLFSKLYVKEDDFEIQRDLILKAKRGTGLDFVFDQKNVHDFFPNADAKLLDGIAMCSQIVPILSRGLNGNPRQTKRFLNTLLIRMQMGSSKGIVLKYRILAKLMLLEYFKPETFTSFHDIQAANNGKLSILSPLEQEHKDEDLSAEQKLLKEDTWIAIWAMSDPKISTENMQPYFYFSREKIGITAVSMQRMTPKAQDLLEGLLSGSNAVQKGAIKKISNVSESEAASVFEAITQKIRQAESANDNTLVMKVLFDLCRSKPALQSQLITFLRKMNEKTLPLTVVVLAEGLLKDSNSAGYKSLITKWAESSVKALAKVAKSKLEK